MASVCCSNADARVQVPRDRPNRHLMQAEIHRRLEDAAEQQRERELPELDFTEHTAGDDHQHEQQGGRAGRNSRVGEIAQHQLALRAAT